MKQNPINKAWKKAIEFMKRSYSMYDDPEKRKFLPEPNGIYKCFETRDSEGYFMLTDTHLNFYVTKKGATSSLDGDPFDHVPYSQYAFINTQIKDITSICANYEKIFNKAAFIRGLLCGALSLLSFWLCSESYANLFWGIPCLGAGIYFIIGAYSFLRTKMYKINIGTSAGGITVIGDSGGANIPKTLTWNNPMTVVYNAEPLEYELINFIEKINLRITRLQERGEFAFDDCLEKKEAFYREHK